MKPSRDWGQATGAILENVDEGREDGFDRLGWLLPGAALLLVGGLLVLTLVPRTESPSPSLVPSASVPSASAGDEHEVVTDSGVVSFRIEDDAIVVRLRTDAGTTELGRADLPFSSSAPPNETRSPSGTSAFLLVCGAVGPEARRYFFGHLDVAGTVNYSGPDAVGHAASDGLFLYALVPGAAAGPAEIKANQRPIVGFGRGAFDDASVDGAKQPSGCFVLG